MKGEGRAAAAKREKKQTQAHWLKGKPPHAYCWFHNATISGNPGRPRGSRNKATVAAESLLEGEAERLTRKAVERALEGDVAALKLRMDRLLPPRRERSLRLRLPQADAAVAAAKTLEELAKGELTTGEAESVVPAVEAYTRMLVVDDFERRLSALEETQNKIGITTP